MTVSSDLAIEEGPAHLKSFLFKCSVGDHFETYGEGSSKKEVKEMLLKNVKKLQSEAKNQRIECSPIFKEVMEEEVKEIEQKSCKCLHRRRRREQ